MKKTFQLLTLLLLFTSANLLAQDHVQHLLFETNSYALSQKSKTELDAWITRNADSKNQLYRVQGFADSRNTDTYNNELAGKRAHTIAEYLRAQGFDAVFEQSYGEGQPVCGEDTPECLALNRRVELWTNGEQDGITLADYFGRKKPQLFYINPKIDNEIKGEEGTTLIIPAFSFHRDGRSIQDTVRIELTEFYNKGEMILNGLSTATKDDLIESGGSILLEAYKDQKELALQGGKTIAIEFKDRTPGDGMVTFYGNTTAYNVQSCGANYGPMAITNESAASGNDPGNNQGGISWDPANKKYNYLVRDQALYNNPALRDSARLAARYCIDHNPNYVPYQPGMDIRTNASAGFVESRFKVENKDYALLFDQVNCYYRPASIPAGTATSPATSSAGTFNTPGKSDKILLISSQLGWINCDRWLSSNLPLVTAKMDGTGENCFYYLIFEDIQSIMPGYTDCKSGQITFPNIPRGQKAQLIAIKIENGKYSLGMKNIRCENELYTLEMKEMPKEEIRKILSGDAWELEARN